MFDEDKHFWFYFKIFILKKNSFAGFVKFVDSCLIENCIEFIYHEVCFVKDKQK